MLSCQIMSSLLMCYFEYEQLFSKTDTFNVDGSVHRKYIPIRIQQDATLHSLFISGNCSTCFGWYIHPSSGAHATVSTASAVCHTVTAICRYRVIWNTMGRVAQSVERLATGWTVRGSNPERPLGQRSFLYIGYRVFPGGKERSGRDADPSPPSSAVVMKE